MYSTVAPILFQSSLNLMLGESLLFIDMEVLQGLLD